MPLRQRDYRLVEHTTSLCSECLRPIDAKIVEREGSIYILKRCPVHGEQSALREKNADYYLRRTLFDKPATASTVQTATRRGCPLDCGLCPDHEQHTCIGVIEVTGRCDLRCPFCYSAPNRSRHLDLSQIGRMVEFFQQAEGGRAEVLQISGGEPCLHPRILDILRSAMRAKLRYVMLNTNGVRIAQDPDFAARLADLGPGFEVYLQFDGLTGSTSMRLRQTDLARLRRKAVANLCDRGVQTTLVSTVSAGVNDHELGDILRFGLNQETVRGVNFQPMARFRGGQASATQPITLTGVLELLERQSRGLLRINDFVPLPCDVERVALTYMGRTGGRFVPLTRAADIVGHLGLLRNTFVFDLDDLLDVGVCGCAKDRKSARTLLRRLAPMIPSDYTRRSLSQKVSHFNANVFRVSASSFVDPATFDLRSIQKECVHVITPDLRRIPFSAYNMFHRGT